jgi:hypothetical protein
MTGQLARRLAAVCIVLTALAAAACAAVPSSGGGRTQHVDSTPIGRAHFWGAMSEEPDTPPLPV